MDNEYWFEKLQKAFELGKQGKTFWEWLEFMEKIHNDLALVMEPAKEHKIEKDKPFPPINVNYMVFKGSDYLNVKKKNLIVQAVEMNFPGGFSVTTPTGRAFGEFGDYLMIGVNGERYPIKKDIFEKTYDIIEE